MAGRHRRPLGVERVQGIAVRVIVDGARMLSPNELFVADDGTHVRLRGFLGSTRSGYAIWSVTPEENTP